MFKKIVLLVIFLFPFFLFSQKPITFISWNIRDFGKTKSSEELESISEIVRYADIVAIQEVVSGFGGAQAVAKLADNLNRKGSKWDYVVSDPTNSTKYVTERYAFLWKTKYLKIKHRGQLISELDSLVDREPFYLDFYIKDRKFTVINFHSRPHNKNPEKEILAITEYIKCRFLNDAIILAGDFNIDEKETVFKGLKTLGYSAAIKKQTTLKLRCERNNYLNYSIDNIFFSKKIKKIQGSTIDFIGACGNLVNARMLSDHLPVYFKYSLQ